MRVLAVPRSIARSLEKTPKRASNIRKLLFVSEQTGLSNEKVTDLPGASKIRNFLMKTRFSADRYGCIGRGHFLSWRGFISSYYPKGPLVKCSIIYVSAKETG